MKKLVRSWTFWFLLLGLLGAIGGMTGVDDIGLFIGFNPVLNRLAGSALGEGINRTPYLWELLSVVTMVGYGLVLDLIRWARGQ